MAEGKIKKEIEQIRINGVVIKDLLNERFLKKLEDNKISHIPILLVLSIPEENNFVTLTHENPKEFEDKILHINSKNQTTMDKVVKVLEKLND